MHGDRGTPKRLAVIDEILPFILCMVGNSPESQRFPSQDGGTHPLHGKRRNLDMVIADTAHNRALFHPRPEGIVA